MPGRTEGIEAVVSAERLNLVDEILVSGPVGIARQARVKRPNVRVRITASQNPPGFDAEHFG